MGNVHLSVIIPTFNRAPRLQACLEALKRQTLSGAAFEVIVVVDGSTDGTWELLARLQTPYVVRSVWQDNSGQNAALNRGLREARGEFVVFLDDDIVVEPEFLAEHLRVQQGGRNVVGVGQLTLQVPANAGWIITAYAETWAGHYADLNGHVRTPTWMDCFGGNMSAPRSALLQVGGVATDIVREHDIELALRLGEAGLQFQYVAAAIGHQDEQKGFFGLEADWEASGAAWVDICARHPAASPHLLGSYHHSRWRASALQWLLLSLSVPPRLLALALLLVGKKDRRAFQFLRNYCYWRGIRRQVRNRTTWQQLTGGTRMLMYHAFGERGEPGSQYVIPVQRFARQLRWLKRLGFNVIGLEEYLACRHEGRLPPPRSLVITIDDGYVDVYRLAFPLLAAHGFPATIFLVSGQIEGSNCWSAEGPLRGRALLSWDQIRELHNEGLRFGAHTRTHPRLTDLPPEAAREEMAGSRADLEKRLSEPIRTFAYPYGDSDPVKERIAEEVGFLGSCGIEPGLNTLQTPLQALRRMEIFGTDSILAFLWKVIVGDSRLLRYL